MKCLAQGHNTSPGWGSNLRPYNQESDALRTELSVLPKTNIVLMLINDCKTSFQTDLAVVRSSSPNTNLGIITGIFLDSLETLHNHTYAIYSNFYSCKNDKFLDGKSDIFLIFAQNIDFGF